MSGFEAFGTSSSFLPTVAMMIMNLPAGLLLLEALHKAYSGPGSGSVNRKKPLSHTHTHTARGMCAPVVSSGDDNAILIHPV